MCSPTKGMLNVRGHFENRCILYIICVPQILCCKFFLKIVGQVLLPVVLFLHFVYTIGIGRLIVFVSVSSKG